MDIHLLEPYRSAFISQCLNESLIVTDPPNYAFLSPGIKATNIPELKEDVLQIAVLANNLSMVFTNVGEEVLKRNLPYMKDSGISDLGVIKLINKFPNEDFIKQRWSSAKSLNDIWLIEKDELDIHRDLILSQLASRGKPIDLFIFNLLKAFRLSDDTTVKMLLNSVPYDLMKSVDTIVNNPEKSIYEFDMPIIMTLQELFLTHSNATTSGFKIVGAFPTLKNEAQAINQIWAILIDKLLETDIDFPVPEKIVDVINLRNRPEIADF